MNSIALSVPAVDHQLLRRVAEGDRQAFDELYATYSASIFNYIIRLVHEPSVAEEILQEVFLAAWRGASRFREQARVKTWLLHIAHNQTVTWLRRHHPVSKLDDLVEVAADDHVEDQIAVLGRADQVRAALDQLSANHRAVIELAYVQELSYAEIATVMSCPIGTVKSRMSYALRHLGNVLAETNLE